MVMPLPSPVLDVQVRLIIVGPRLRTSCPVAHLECEDIPVGCLRDEEIDAASDRTGGTHHQELVRRVGVAVLTDPALLHHGAQVRR